MISIIMPVYNVEKYVDRAIRSVLAQTYQDYELLLIDNGSTDRSGEICDRWQGKTRKIIVTHLEKPGVSEARNWGLQHASGEYVCFVDSDDCVTENYLKALHDAIEEYQADVVKCDLAHDYGKGVQWRPSAETELLDRAGAIAHVLRTDTSMCDRLYRKSLFAGLRFPEQIRHAEDVYTLLNVLRLSSRIVVIHNCAYIYLHRKDSITTCTYNSNDRDVLRVWRRNYRYISETYPELEALARARMLWSYCVMLDKMYLSGYDLHSEDARIIISVLRKNRKVIMRNSLYTKYRKLSIAVLLVNKYFYYIFVYAQKYLFRPLN